MPCYICKTKTGPFQRLEVARLRFIRKAQPHFKDDSYLCTKCFQQFEKIYKLKKTKNDSTASEQPSISNASIRSISTKTDSSRDSTRSHLTVLQRSNNENKNDNDNNSSSNVIQFDSRSLESHQSSIDSTDKIVQLQANYLSLRDSSRKTTKNPELIVARQGAEGAVRRVLTRQEILPEENTTPVRTSDGNTSPNNIIQFDSSSIDSNISIDSTDRIVQMASEILSLRDSTRKTAKNAELNVARQGAEAAMQSVLRRQGQVSLRERSSPPAQRRRLEIVDEENASEEDIDEIQLSPSNLAHVRPIVRRRKEPVVQQFGDVMDLYVSRTSGG